MINLANPVSLQAQVGVGAVIVQTDPGNPYDVRVENIVQFRQADVARLQYDPVTGRAEYLYPGESLTFLPSDRETGSQARRLRWSSPDRSSLVIDQQPLIDLQPPGVSNQSNTLQYSLQVAVRQPDQPTTLNGVAATRTRLRLMIFGTPSRLADLIPNSRSFGPLSCSRITLVPAGLNASYTAVGQSLGRIATGERRTSFSLVLNETRNAGTSSIGLFQLNGTLDPVSNLIEGVAEGGPPGWTGTWSGALYGPLRNEIGFVFELSGPLSQPARIFGMCSALREQF